MSKQDKVVNKIKNIGAQGSQDNLHKKNNDECYTPMNVIINELSYWADKNKFQGKRIICPCDWDITDDSNIYSIEVEFKDRDIEVTGNSVYKAVKRVSLFLFEEELTPTKIDIAENDIENFLRDKLVCNFLRVLTQKGREWGIKSVTASGYNPATNKGIKFQDVDYSKYDICITNPPFSIYNEFLDTLENKINYIVLAPYLNRANPNIGLRIMTKKCYLGKGIELGINFYNPTSSNAYKNKSVACDWITTFDDAQKERNIEISKKQDNQLKSGNFISYEIYKDEYSIKPNMTMKNGEHPIIVPGAQFPINYNGWMFSSIHVLNNISFDEYEWYGTSFHKYFNREHPELNPFAHNACNKMVEGSIHGIVFRKKVPQE